MSAARLRKKPEKYPPRKFRAHLRELREAHPDKPSVEVLAEILQVTPLTMARIEDGIDLKLSHALRLAKVFDQTVEQIWEMK